MALNRALVLKVGLWQWESLRLEPPTLVERCCGQACRLAAEKTKSDPCLERREVALEGSHNKSTAGHP